MFWVPCTDHWETDASKNETWRVILLTVHVQHPVPKYEHIKQTKSSTTENVVDIFFCNDSFVSRTCVCLVSRDPRIIAKIAVFWLPDFFKKIRDSKNTIFEVSKYWKICDFHTKKKHAFGCNKVDIDLTECFLVSMCIGLLKLRNIAKQSIVLKKNQGLENTLFLTMVLWSYHIPLRKQPAPKRSAPRCSEVIQCEITLKWWVKK